MSKKSKAVMRAQKRKKIDAVNAFGGCCQICGYNRCIEALEFHHLNKEEKEEKPSYVIMRWSWERAMKELEKCILVCSNCHKEIHASEKGDFDIELQIKNKTWIQKKCSHCNNEFKTMKVGQTFCSLSCSSKSRIIPWIQKKCSHCDNEFKTKRNEQKYCSSECSDFGSRKVKRPSKGELKGLMDRGLSWVKLGKMFGVSDNGVRKWAKKYELI